MSDGIKKKLSPAAAVLVGQLWVNGPVVGLLLGTLFGGALLLQEKAVPWTVAVLAFVGGVLMAWLWWSFMVPLWRRWAIDRGVDAEKTQRLAVMSGLTWPKGWVFEKTEIRLKRKS